MKKKIGMMLFLGLGLWFQGCQSAPQTDPDKDAAHKRANREEYAERIQDAN